MSNVLSHLLADEFPILCGSDKWGFGIDIITGRIVGKISKGVFHDNDEEEEESVLF